MPTTTHGVNAALSKTGSTNFGLDGYLVENKSSSFSINGYLSIEKTKAGPSLNAVLLANPSKTLSISAYLEKRGTFHNIDARLFSEVVGTNLLTLYYANKDPQDVAEAAMYITQFEDLDSNNWKHVKHVDFIGDYGNNEVELSYSFTPNYTVWSNYMSFTPSDYPDQAARFYNLGQGRRMAFKVIFSGSSQIYHEAIEVSYNIRTQ